MRKEIYLRIIERLKESNLNIKHFSLWNNDIYYMTKSKGFKTPAVFIEFERIDWKQLQNRTREADFLIRLHIVTNTLANPEDGSRTQTEALAHLDLLEGVVNALQGFCGDGFNAFMLKESETDHDHEEVWHNEELFTTHVTDRSGQRTPIIATNIEPSIKATNQ